MKRADDILDNISSRKTSGESFVLATVVRMVAATAAKAGAKAVVPPYLPEPGHHGNRRRAAKRPRRSKQSLQNAASRPSALRS